MGWRFRTAICVGIGSWALWTGVSADASDRKALDELRALLASGKAAEALEKARGVLAVSGDDPDVLEIASDAAAAAKSADEALWFAHAARAAAIRLGKGERAIALASKAAALEPPDLGERAPLDAAANRRLEAAKLCARKRFWVNAVQMLSTLESTQHGDKAASELERIYANKQAVAALLDSCVGVPRTATDRKLRAKAALDDANHATWDTALSVETANYTIVTDAGHEVAGSVATAMEPMNAFYRRVFRTKDKPGAKHKKGGDVPRCTVRVFRSKAEMVAVTKIERDVLGFYSPADNSVTVYDPRSEGLPFAGMWTTLFHEASHQFTEMISQSAVPSWLNEGTASYFEGAALRPDGRVDTNLVPPYRLAGCIDAFRTGSPTLREVIAWSSPESYPAEYYPVGWALVFFLRNYEDEKYRKVYEKAYDALIDSYRKAEGLPSFERFEKFVIADLKQPGVADFDAFEARFRKWIEDLDYFHGGPASAALDFTERAKKRLEAGRRDDAEDDLRLALEKNPDYVPALVALGDVLEKRGRRDEAVACFRRVYEAVRRDVRAAGFSPMEEAEAAELAKSSLVRIAKIEPEIGAAFAGLEDGLEKAALAEAEKYAAASMPRNALRVLDAAALLLGGAAEVEERRRTLAEEAGVDILLPRTVDLRPGADRVWASDGWKADGARLVAPSAKASLLQFDAALGDRYRFEATIRPKRACGESPFVGILVGAGDETPWKCIGTSGDMVEIWKVLHGWDRVGSPRGLTPEEVRSFRLVVEARPRLLRLYVNGELVAGEEFPAGALRGGVGLVALDAAAEFEDVRLSY